MHSHQQKIDHVSLGLSVLCITASPGQTLTIKAISEVCDCSMKTIVNIQDSAINKLRKRVKFTEHLGE